MKAGVEFDVVSLGCNTRRLKEDDPEQEKQIYGHRPQCIGYCLCLNHAQMRLMPAKVP